MILFLSFSLALLVLFLAIPVAVLLVEVVAAVTFRQRQVMPKRAPLIRVAVLVPAHNESASLLPTLIDIKTQVCSTDRVVVVADNCTDDTAAVATAAGTLVIDRRDPEKKGKGYALAAGVAHLALDPPDIVIIIDADCRLAQGAIDGLTAVCALTNSPVQALDLMVAPEETTFNFQVAEFAWRVKNWVRPLGLKALGLPCQLMGTGMAFPWNVIRSVNLTSGSVVEDLNFGLDLAAAGFAPVFAPFPCVTSEFPTTVEGVQTQRARWEIGHISTILRRTPSMVFVGIFRANFNLLALALDLAVPPLSLLGILLMGMLLIVGLAMLFGISPPSVAWLSAASLTGFVCAVFLSWLKFGRDVVPPSALLLAPSFIFEKICLYARLISRPNSQWVRTDRRKL
jgi:cellulose synthase/poly-beta-1,6-N-acetylglucosamine synthase-like glycosyltransferase